LEEADLFVKEVFVDGGRILKRLDPLRKVALTAFEKDQIM
jgi:ribosomal protein L22